VFIIHEQQRYQILQVENQHLVGEVQVKMMGRGPSVLKSFEPANSVEAADLVALDGPVFLGSSAC
jgi:hypothetical protein